MWDGECIGVVWCVLYCAMEPTQTGNPHGHTRVVDGEEGGDDAEKGADPH